MSVLSEIQKKLAVPKEQFNKFGGFAYRSAEDILSTVKPLLPEDCIITTSTTPQQIGDNVYQICYARLQTPTGVFEAIGSAREPESKKGMDASQISGAAISYAKKYALGNLFALDNEKDADSMAPDEMKPEKLDYSELKEAVTQYAKFKGKDVNQAKREVWSLLPTHHSQEDIQKLSERLITETEELYPEEVEF